MNKSISVILFTILFIHSSLLSQNWEKINMYQMDAETFMFDKQYIKAAETFKKALKLMPDNSNLKFKVGYCYFNSDDRRNEAIPFLKEASENVKVDYKEQSLKEVKAPIIVFYLLAEIYRFNNQFDEAIEAYNKYKEYLKPEDKLFKLADQNITSCKNATYFIQDSVRVIGTNMGSIINTDLPNINAVVSGDGKTIAYTTISKINNDIFISNKVNNAWTTPKKITSQLGNKYLLTNSLSFDGKILYLSSDDPENCDIFVSTIEKNKWINALKFEKPINTKSNETHACVSKDGNTIYFTSDRKGGLGGFDIYKAVVNEKGVWGEPVNLGTEINTIFNEVSPFLSSDEKYLFFSSQGHPGMGGYDIFYVNLEGPKKVQNMGYPVSNTDNNQFYCPEKDWKSGFISYYDKSSMGSRDIYHIEISRYTNLNGKVIADASDSDKSFIVKILDIERNDTITKFESTNNKSFSYKVGTGNYQIIINNNKYIPFTKDLAIADDSYSKELSFEAKMQLLPIEKPKLIAEVLPVVTKKDSVIIEKPKPIIVAENPKKEVKVEPSKPKEIKKEEVKKKIVPKVKIENTSNSSSGVKISSYAVQLMALKTDDGASALKGIDNVEITQSPEGFYRYSVGSTESMNEAMATLDRVKALGYTKAYVRIDKFDATYTVQIMASNKPVDLSTFNNISDVNETLGSDGLYRYTVGSFASHTDAKSSLGSIIESGYSKAFIKKVRLK